METFYSAPAPEAAPPQKRAEGRVLQLVLSLLIFAGFVVFLFVPASALGISLFDEVLALFGSDFAGTTVYTAALYAVIGMYAVLLVCTIVGAFLRNGKAAKLNLLKTAVALLVLLFYVYSTGMPLELVFTAPDTFVALNSTVFSFAFGFIALVVLLFTAYKTYGFIKLFSVLFAAAFLAGAEQVFIGSFAFADLVAGIDLGGGGALETATAIVFQVFACALLANLAIALFSTLGKKTLVLDFVRACVVFVLAIAAFVLLGVYDSFANGFTYVGTVIAAAVAVAQFLFWLIVLLVVSIKKKRAKKAQKPAESPFVVGEDNQLALRGWESPAEPTAEAAPAPAAEEPAATTFDDADRINSAFEEAAQLSFDDIAAEPETPVAEETADAEPEIDAYESAIRENEQPAEAEKEAEKPYDFDRARYDGTFNRAYADFTAQQQAAQPSAEQPQPAQQPAPEPAAPERPYEKAGEASASYFRPRTYAAPAAAQPAPAYYDTPVSAGYVPDAFLNGLNAAERDEFTKLFISRIYGENKRLPVYTVGGDNREFFTKIFVFMGRYRNVISDSLLEKIYEYSNLVR